jgi:hypothetical protein
LNERERKGERAAVTRRTRVGDAANARRRVGERAARSLYI